jgi:hypothetical protein
VEKERVVRALIAAGGVAHQGGIADGFDVNQSYVDLHLAVLRDKGLSLAVQIHIFVYFF